METIQLDDYNIYVGDCSQPVQDFLGSRRYSRYFILADDNTERDCLPVFLEKTKITNYQLIRIPAGEPHKNIETCTNIWQQMMEADADRKALTINLGGGVIGDMGGFCASTFKRGMDFVQVPTTLLSQVDASIGGKLGIDFQDVKNSIGLFRNPAAVFADPAFFATLPAAEIRSGFAEIIKHSLIADAGHWAELRQVKQLNNVDWPSLVSPSLHIKKAVVTEDPFERGLRKALNFGHTIGHAIESFALHGDQPLLHGEAIAIGMICEAWLSHKKTNLPEAQLEEITQFILRLYPNWKIPEAEIPRLIRLMRNDKKNEDGKINFSLLPAAGQVEVNQTATAEEIRESLLFYNTKI